MAFDPLNRLDHDRFWLQILGDHSRFILGSLSPQEGSEIEKARSFINRFDDLLSKARQGSAAGLKEEAYSAAQDIRAFKLHLLKRHLTEKIEFNLLPVFLNHMLNEVEEYLYILETVKQNKRISFHPVHLHIVWMLDGSGHAQTIADRLGANYKDLRNIADMFALKFSNEHEKALEMRGFLRTGLTDFPSLDDMNQNAEFEMKDFMDFLKNTENLIRGKNVLSILQPLMLDHMFREECYYLTLLSLAANIEKPHCDPTTPRRE